MHFSLAQDNIKMPPSCSKCDLGCSQKFVPQFPPLHYMPLIPCLAVSVVERLASDEVTVAFVSLQPFCRALDI